MVNPAGVPSASQPDAACTPTDQDAYVWRPARLQVQQTCVRASGIVMELSAAEADGDAHIHLQLDAASLPLLAAGNQHINGYLVVEAVCQYPPPHSEALLICASDPDPLAHPMPHIGDHIWVEGRPVLDLWHYSWAELHPLYRWGIVSP